MQRTAVWIVDFRIYKDNMDVAAQIVKHHRSIGHGALQTARRKAVRDKGYFVLFFQYFCFRMSAQFPLVSIICNCYNHAPYVLEALYSAVQQTYKNTEIIVINNGSADDSQKVIENYVAQHPEIKFLDLKKTLPHTQAFNKAFRLSKGDYLIDLSGDDVLYENTVEKQLEFFKKQDTDVGLIFGNALHIDRFGQPMNTYFTVNEQNKVLDQSLFRTDYAKLLKGGHSMCAVSAMMKREQFEKLGGYDDALFFEDLDYWLRLSYEYKIAFLDEILIKKRHLDDSLGNQMLHQNRLTKKLNESLRRIYLKRIAINSADENRLLLKRIHYSAQKSIDQKNWQDAMKFILISFRCRFAALSKNQ